MTENRVWAVLRRTTDYACALCGYRQMKLEGAPAYPNLWQLVTPRNDNDPHTLEVCETCLLAKFNDAADPFGLIPRPEEVEP